MRASMPRWILLLAAIVLVFPACGSSEGVQDAGMDGFDGNDAGSDGTDSGDQGVQLPLPGFGVITGHCGVLDEEEWNSAEPFMFRNSIDFDSLVFDENELSAGGQKIFNDPNAGGSSIHSEVFAYEVLYRCELAGLLKTETEIEYDPPESKKTDILVSIDERKIGVSVVRAFHYPPEEPCNVQEIEEKIEEKLSDILLSAAGAVPEDAWVRSILHVIAYNSQCADLVETAFLAMTPQVRDETIVVITVTDGDDDFIY
jgi:hypothetical protein